MGDIEVVAFDLGNTLFFLRESYSKASTARFEKMKDLGYEISREEYDKISKKAIKIFKGKHGGKPEKHIPGNFMNIFFDLWGEEAPEEDKVEIDKTFFEVYAKSHEPDQYADEIIRFCKNKGILVGIISNGNKIMVKNMLDKLEAKEEIDLVLYSTKSGRKSTLHPFHEFLDGVKFKPEKCLMVGDRKDEDMYAKKLGMKTAWYKKDPSGASGKKIEPDHEVKSLREIKEIISNTAE